MTTVREEVGNLAWTDSDDGAWRSRLRAAQRDDDEGEFAAFVSPGFQSVNADALSGDGIRRFTRGVDAALAASTAQRASGYTNPYTAAILLDYAATDKQKSQENRTATLAAADRYIDAIEHFGNSGAVGNHVLAVGDAVARAVDLLAIYRDPSDRLVSSVENLIVLFAGTRDEEFIGNLAVALTRRHPDSRVVPVFQSLYSRMKAAVDSMSDPLHRGRCALDLDRLAKLAGQGADYRGWSPEIAGGAALELASSTPPLVASARLMGALLHAVQNGHQIRGQLMDALAGQKESLLGAGVDIRVAELRLSLDGLAEKAETVLAASSLADRMVTLAGLVSVPARADRIALAQLFDVGPTASLVTFLPIGEHGPTGDSPESLADHQALEAIVLRDATVIDECLQLAAETTDLEQLLPAREVASLLVEAHLIEAGQESILADVWCAWARGNRSLALFGLFPFVEQAFRQTSGRSVGLSRARSLVVRTGDSLVHEVRDVFGEDVAEVFAHLLAKEGAHRHGFAHGYVRESPNHVILASYCVFMLCHVFRHGRAT